MKKSAVIRAVLCVIVIILVILSWTKVIPSTPSMTASTLILCVVSTWNAIENLQAGRKNAAIFNFAMAAIILLLCIGIIIL